MNEKFDPDDLVSAKKAGELVQQNSRTIIAWIKNGWLPAVKRPGPRGRYMIRYEDLVNVANRPYVPQGETDEQPPV